MTSPFWTLKVTLDAAGPGLAAEDLIDALACDDEGAALPSTGSGSILPRPATRHRPGSCIKAYSTMGRHERRRNWSEKDLRKARNPNLVAARYIWTQFWNSLASRRVKSLVVRIRAIDDEVAALTWIRRHVVQARRHIGAAREAPSSKSHGGAVDRSGRAAVVGTVVLVVVLVVVVVLRSSSSRCRTRRRTNRSRLVLPLVTAT